MTDRGEHDRAWNRSLLAGAVLGAEGPAPDGEGAPSVAGDPAPGAGGDPGRRRRLRRGAGLGRGAAGLPAPLSAFCQRRPVARHAQRRDQRARPRAVQALLRHPADANGVGPCGTGAAKGGWVDGLRTDQPEFVAIDGKTSRRCHARAKGREALHLVSAPPAPWRRLLRSRIGQRPMGQPPAAGARPGGGGRQVERDHRHPAAARAARARRCPGHRSTPSAARPRSPAGDPGQGGRLSPGGEDQLARAPCRDRALLRRTRRPRLSTGWRPPTATMAGSRSAATW